MPIDTVNVRFPRRFHTQAKMAAAQRQMSLQEFLEHCVKMETQGNKGGKPISATAMKVAELPEEKQLIVRDLLKFLDEAPERYIKDGRAYMITVTKLARRGLV